ncbi:hypothetical protein MLD38_027085 [Melastoma candidum]|uniref:Uncharacterized protein n=1 Tax=Melastoma candidum TaxID=119954 RepID=A0ACB9P135_9MYRT|nr:hypothetical protein MLD38_027085 [Melastoma candidum]
MCHEMIANTSFNGGKAVPVNSLSGGDLHQHQHQQHPVPLSRYESQKRRDWNTFGQYLRNQRPPVAISQFTASHVLEFLRYLDQFGKTKVHVHGCGYFGQPEPPGPCTCPLRQAWGSLDALIGRLRAAYEENGGLPEVNPFASGAIRIFLREVRESQAKARGIPYRKKKKKKHTGNTATINSSNANANASATTGVEATTAGSSSNCNPVK